MAGPHSIFARFMVAGSGLRKSAFLAIAQESAATLDEAVRRVLECADQDVDLVVVNRHECLQPERQGSSRARNDRWPVRPSSALSGSFERS